MDKAERLAYMKRRFPELEETMSDAVIPISKRDVQDAVADLDSFREFARDKQTSKEALTSDEV